MNYFLKPFIPYVIKTWNEYDPGCKQAISGQALKNSCYAFTSTGSATYSFMVMAGVQSITADFKWKCEHVKGVMQNQKSVTLLFAVLGLTYVAQRQQLL